jgi:hypothetical protein
VTRPQAKGLAESVERQIHTPPGLRTPASSGPRSGVVAGSGPGVPRNIYDGHPPFNPKAYRQQTRAGAAAMGYGILGLSIGFFLAFIVAPRVAEWMA